MKFRVQKKNTEFRGIEITSVYNSVFRVMPKSHFRKHSNKNALELFQNYLSCCWRKSSGLAEDFPGRDKHTRVLYKEHEYTFIFSLVVGMSFEPKYTNCRYEHAQVDLYFSLVLGGRLHYCVVGTN
jgi:hypothetical protein